MGRGTVLVDEPRPRGRLYSSDAESRSGRAMAARRALLELRLHNAERLCDLDGDGLDDNGFADLGEPHATLLTTALTAAIAGEEDESAARVLVHFPWVDDLGPPEDPDTKMIVCNGDDLEEPDDPTNDWSGSEPFHMTAGCLDGCGEPRFLLETVSIRDGAVSASTGSFFLVLNDPIEVMGARAEGIITAGAQSLEADLCGYMLISEIGTTTGFEEAGGATMLEILLAGSSALGMATLPGLEPDVDLDGDGLERVLLDEDGAVRACVDGDLQEIEGADCFLDSRIADGFSFNLSIAAVPARYVGRKPGWETEVDGGCDGGPPDSSLLDP